MPAMNSIAVLGATYNYGLVALSIALLIFVLIAAVAFAGRVRAVVSSTLDRIKVLRKRGLSTSREHELYFQTMAEAVPEIIWTADPNGMDDFFNQKCFDYTGLTLSNYGARVGRGSSIPMTWTVACQSGKVR